jgi:hypothetical protein
LRPNHSQIVDIGFKAQPRNPHSSSPCARCRSHRAPLDLSIVRPLSTCPVRLSPVLCTRSPTPVTILIVARRATPATYTPRDKQTRFSERNKDKRKIKRNYPGFEFKPRQVNDSSQSKQGTDHLVSQQDNFTSRDLISNNKTYTSLALQDNFLLRNISCSAR